MLFISLLLTISAVSVLPARSGEQDSLRGVLHTTTLSNTARVAVLERLVFLYMDTKPDTALLYAWQLYTIANNANNETNRTDERMMVSALAALVNGYTNTDKPDKILQYGFQLLHLSEELRDTVRLARALYATGFASGQLTTKNNPDENASAFRSLQRALALAIQQHDKRLTVECYNAIGRIYRKEQKFDSALLYHTWALDMAIAHDIPAQQGWALNSIAICYENKGNLAKALDYALASFRCYERVGNPTTTAFPLSTITRVYQKLGNFPQALVFAKRSLTLAMAAGARSAQYQSCERIAEILEALGDYRGALVYQRRSVTLRDSIATLEHTDDFRRLQTQNELLESKHEQMQMAKNQKAQQSALERQQLIVIIVVFFLILFALMLLLLLRARRVVKRRNMQLERATKNVQEQIRIQTAQHQELVKFKRILDESTDYVVMADAKTNKVLYMNKAYRTLIGVEVPPPTLEDLMNIVYAPDLAEKVLREDIPLAIERGIIMGETSLLNAQGGQSPVLHTTICHKDEHGVSVLLSSIMRDITERKHHEQALEQLNARLRSLLETFPFPIAVTRRGDGKPLFNNAPMQKLIGLSSNIDEHPQAIDYYQDPNDRGRVLAELAANGRIDGLELALKKPNGEHWWALLSIVLMEFEGDAALFSAFQDITARKRAEELLRHINEEILHQKDLLEEQSRDIEMANSQLEAVNEVLIDRNKQLVELDREKNEILGIVTHDLKNPIAAVRGLVELASSGSMDAEQTKEIHAQIAVTSGRMMKLVENLLHVNRLESDLQAFQTVAFDILPFVESAIRQYTVQAETKTITLHYAPESASSLVLADEHAVMQVLDNLLSNAVKYSPHGKNVFVKVGHSSLAIGHSSGENRPHPTDQSTNGYVRVEVKDEGQGISPEEMKKLFGKFVRLSARPTGGEHSSGLGLSIVKKMVEAMNGRVWCESELGQGATFIVELPKA